VRRLSLALIVPATLMALASSAFAQDPAPAGNDRAQRPGTAAPSPARPTELQTAKERLSEKWTDEQRVDNCKVPIDKRGPKPRPDCPGLLSQPSGQTPHPQPLGQMSTK
jgi:hypothetical protein